MIKQKQGVSRLVYALYNYDAETKTITFGEVKELAPVKSISITIEQAKEDVAADNKVQYSAYGATTATRSFEVTGVPTEVEAELMGQSVVSVGTKKFTGTAPDGSAKPYFAFGYALHDGDKNRPCKVVWTFKAQVDSISCTSKTMGGSDTSSEPQTIEVTYFAPDIPWTTTGKDDLDIALDITEENKADVEKWFTQVVTYDNVSEIFAE